MSPLGDRRLRFEEPGGKQGAADLDGRIVVPPEWTSVWSIGQGLLALEREGTLVLAREDGSRVGSSVFRPPENIGVTFEDGLLQLGAPGGGYGYVDSTGAWVIPPRFTSARSFSGGLAAVTLDRALRRWGFVDRAGSLVIPPSLRQVDRFENGVAKVYEEGVEGDRFSYLAPSGRFIYSARGRKVAGESLALVITGAQGGPAPTELREELARRWQLALELGEGYPRSVPAAELGLPGREPLLVAGFCADEAQAARVRDLLRLDLPQVDVRWVAGGDPGSCPKLGLRPAPGPQFLSQYTPITTRAAFDEGWPGYDLQLATSRPVRMDGKPYFKDAVLRLLAGEQEVTAEELRGTLHPDSRDHLLFQPRLLKLGKRAFVLVRAIGSILDREGTTRESPNPQRLELRAAALYGYADGKLRELARFGLRAGVEAVKGDWRRLRVTDPEDRLHPRQEYLWDDARSEFYLVGARKPLPGSVPPTPIVFHGCWGERCCITGDALIRPATIHREPRVASPVVATLPTGTRILEAAFVNVVPTAPKPVVLDRESCFGSGLDLGRFGFDDRPRKAFQLSATRDRAAVYSLDGEVVVLPACLSRHEEDPPAPERWLEITAESGETGFSQAWEAVPQEEDGACVWGDR